MSALRARRRLAPLLAGIIVAIVAAIGLSSARHSLRAAVPPHAAIVKTLRDPAMQHALAGSHWTRVEANPIDGRLERVSFWAGEQIVAEAAVDRDGQLTVANDRAPRVPYGDWIAYRPLLLAGFGVVFLLATMVTPWRRIRNLDAIAALSLIAPIVLFQHRYLDPSLILAAPGLACLMARCAWMGLGRKRAAGPSVPLLTALTLRLPGRARVTWLRVALIVLALIFVMIGVSSPLAVDVTFAVMEGATKLLHGVLPYGHMPPGIIHGDTYPILSYALYAPVALFAPVPDAWHRVDAALVVAVLAAFGLAWAALRSARRGLRSPEAEEAGLRSAIAVLSFPGFLITTSTGTTDVLMAAMLAGALVLWRRPAAGATTLAVAGWFKLAPFALVPVFVASLRGRRLACALAVLGAVSLAVFGLVVGVGGMTGAGAMVRAVSYQFTRGSLQSIWSVLGIESLQPLAQSCVLGLIAGACVKLCREPELAQDRARMAALSAAILIGLQLSADYWAFLYVVWFVPLVCVSLFGVEAVVAPAAAAATVGETPALALAT